MRATVPAETGDDCLQTGILFPVRRFTEISVGIIDGLLRNRKLLLELVCIQPHVTLNKYGNLRALTALIRRSVRLANRTSSYWDPRVRLAG